MQGNSIQRYLRFLGITLLLYVGLMNLSFSQNIYVSKANCIDENPSAAGESVSCTQPTRFFDLGTAPASRTWDFGDGNFSTDLNPTHLYTTKGTYTINFTKCFPCIAPVTKTIVVGTFPKQPLFGGSLTKKGKIKTDTTVCDGKTKLDPYAGTTTPAGVSYLWFPNGETTPTIEVEKSGCYSVEVTSPEGCSRIAQITVKYCLQKVDKPAKKDLWYFGDKGSFEFTNKGTAKPRDPLKNDGTIFSSDSTYTPNTKPTAGNILNSPQAMAMVYGPEGNLLFYSDGKTILTGDNKDVPIETNVAPPISPPTLPNNNILNGDPTTTQSVVIIPKGACNECPHHQYYVFTRNPTTKILSYSIIDMRYNMGKDANGKAIQPGKIIEKDIPVYYPAGEHIAAVATTTDEKGYWVLTHDSSTDKFVAIKVDSTGITTTPQAIGLPHSSVESSQGYIHFSPTGDKVAIAVSNGTKNYVEVYRFDKDTGQLLATPGRIDLPDAPPRVYGVAFSGNGQRLYVTLKGDVALNQQSALYQLNLNLGSAAAIAGSRIQIDVSKIVSFGALQIDSNNETIYMAVDGSTEMYSIGQPDQLGGAALIDYSKPPLRGTEIAGTSKWGLPNVIKAKAKDDDSGPSATYRNTCLNDNTIFETSPLCNPMINKYIWDFGDGTIKEVSTPTTSHKYKKTGTYKVKLTIRTYRKLINTSGISGGIVTQLLDELTDFCTETTVQDEIYIRPSPALTLPDPIYICTDSGQKITLDPKPTGGSTFTYLWSPTNETTSTIEASAIAIYKVNVKNEVGCSSNATTTAKDGCEPIVLIPTTFTPNGDGVNDRLQVISRYVTDFELRIFDRWGELVFYTDSTRPADNQWDGSYNKYIFSPANYAYVVQYKSEYFPDRPMVIKRGGILVVK